MFHAHQLPHIMHYFRNKELDELYASVFLKSLALSFISIFVPVYLYTLGFTLVQISLFFIVNYSTATLFFLLGFYLCSHLGIKKTLALGSIIEILYFYLLAYVTPFNYLFLALVFGLACGLYYSALHLDFSYSLGIKSKGRELSFFHAASITAVTIGPFLGALLIANASFERTLVVVSCCILLSIFPLFLTKDYTYAKNQFTLKKSLHAGSWKSILGHYGEAIGGLAGYIFWPLFIFITLSSIVSLGAIFSLASFITVLLLFVIGKYADKNRNATLVFGAVTHAPIWISRLFFLTPVGLFVNNFLSSITAQALVIPFQKLVYDRAGKHNPANYIFFREVHLTIGRVALLIFAIFFSNFVTIFILAAISTFLYLVPMHKR